MVKMQSSQTLFANLTDLKVDQTKGAGDARLKTGELPHHPFCQQRKKLPAID
jgi:hypothetical protein